MCSFKLAALVATLLLAAAAVSGGQRTCGRYFDGTVTYRHIGTAGSANTGYRERFDDCAGAGCLSSNDIVVKHFSAEQLRHFDDGSTLSEWHNQTFRGDFISCASRAFCDAFAGGLDSCRRQQDAPVSKTDFPGFNDTFAEPLKAASDLIGFEGIYDHWNYTITGTVCCCATGDRCTQTTTRGPAPTEVVEQPRVCTSYFHGSFDLSSYGMETKGTAASRETRRCTQSACAVVDGRMSFAGEEDGWTLKHAFDGRYVTCVSRRFCKTFAGGLDSCRRHTNTFVSNWAFVGFTDWAYETCGFDRAVPSGHYVSGAVCCCATADHCERDADADTPTFGAPDDDEDDDEDAAAPTLAAALLVAAAVAAAGSLHIY